MSLSNVDPSLGGNPPATGNSTETLGPKTVLRSTARLKKKEEKKQDVGNGAEPAARDQAQSRESSSVSSQRHT